jgi:anti-anti-sigma regulatory factor
LGALVAGSAALRNLGGELKMLGLNGRVLEMMELTGLLMIFEVFENEQEATESFQKVSLNASHKTVFGEFREASFSL